MHYAFDARLFLHSPMSVWISPYLQLREGPLVFNVLWVECICPHRVDLKMAFALIMYYIRNACLDLTSLLQDAMLQFQI
jgi:hypothetical protein